MIPIAFIPGVTNRDGNTPPVPPIPAAHSYGQQPTGRAAGSAIFFSPGDLRNSAYSATSTIDSRNTMYDNRLSISPSLARESITSEIYRDDAVANPMPAQQVVMTRPNMVSVKSSSSVTTSPTTGSPATADSPRVVMAASGGLPATQYSKPTAVTIKKSAGRFPVRNASDASSSKPSVRSPLGMDTDTSDSDEEPHARARKSLLDKADKAQSPFSDAAARPNATRGASTYTANTTMSAIIEEATRRASQMPTTQGGPAGHDKRDASPFGDENKVEEE